MIAEERKQYIIDKLKSDGLIKTDEIVKDTGASIATARRDLQELANQNLLVRVNGGAKRIISMSDETSTTVRDKQNISDKNKIAQKAAEVIQDGDVIFLDSGTTVKALIPFLKDFKNILVITNSIDNASTLANYDIKTFILSGSLKNSTKAIIGSQLIEELKKYQFDLAFLGTNGVSVTSGYTTPDPEESAVKSLAIKQSKQSYVLTDASKIDNIAFCKFGNLNEATIVTSNLSSPTKNSLTQQTKVLEAN